MFFPPQEEDVSFDITIKTLFPVTITHWHVREPDKRLCKRLLVTPRVAIVTFSSWRYWYFVSRNYGITLVTLVFLTALLLLSFRGCWSFTQIRNWVTEPPFVWLHTHFISFCDFCHSAKVYLHNGCEAFAMFVLQVGENFPSSVCQIFCWGCGTTDNVDREMKQCLKSRYEIVSAASCRSHGNPFYVMGDHITKITFR